MAEVVARSLWAAIEQEDNSSMIEILNIGMTVLMRFTAGQ